MLSYWTIKLLNALFVCLTATGALWLFLAGLFYKQPERNGMHGKKLGLVTLNLTRKGKPYYRMNLNRGVYSIGASESADVVLMDSTLPAQLGELTVDDECCFRNHVTGYFLYNGDNLNKLTRKRLHSRDKLNIKDYEILIEKY